MSQIRILKNVTESKITLDDLGAFEINGSSQEDISDVFTLEQLYLSLNLSTKINNGDIVINNGQRDLSAEEGILYCTPSSDKPRENPLPYIYLAQANTLQSLFELHTESMELEESLEKCYVDFLDSKRKISSDSNILYDGQGIYLYGNSITDSTIESFNDVSDWDECDECNSNIASFSLDENDKQEGTGSCKIIFTGAEKFNCYGIVKTYTLPQNWSLYENIGIYSKISAASNKYTFCLVLESTLGNLFYTNLSKFHTSWCETIFDITGCSFKADIKKVKIIIVPNGDQNLNINFDLCRISKINSYQSSGYIVSQNISTSANVKSIYIDLYGDVPANSSITTQVSLDGGTNWHTIISSEYGSWVNISDWNEYEDFENLKNIKVKISLATSDITSTPQVDDFLIQWKVEI